jgi:hypothetical protein
MIGACDCSRIGRSAPFCTGTGADNMKEAIYQLSNARKDRTAAPQQTRLSSLMPVKRKFDVGDMVRRDDGGSGMCSASVAGVISEISSEPGARQKTFIVECAHRQCAQNQSHVRM